jgi:hypothetical protein
LGVWAGQTANEIEKHTEVMALVRKLMSKDTSLTLDMAMRRVYRENPSLVPTKPGAMAMTKAEATTGQTFLVRGIECGREIDFGLDSWNLQVWGVFRMTYISPQGDGTFDLMVDKPIAFDPRKFKNAEIVME